MIVLNLFYIAALAAPPVLLGVAWWDWFRSSRVESAKWSGILFATGLCAASANFALWWGWVVWLRFHYSAESWKVRDWVSDLGFWLLLCALIAALAGRGRHRLLLAVSSVLAMLPWIPLGVL